MLTPASIVHEGIDNTDYKYYNKMAQELLPAQQTWGQEQRRQSALEWQRNLQLVAEASAAAQTKEPDCDSTRLRLRGSVASRREKTKGLIHFSLAMLQRGPPAKLDRDAPSTDLPEVKIPIVTILLAPLDDINQTHTNSQSLLPCRWKGA